MTQVLNLNDLDYSHDAPFFEYSRSSETGPYGSRMLGDLWAARNGKRYKRCLVRPVFRDIEQAIIAQIRKSDFVVGCVAWLTNLSILKALSEINGCQFVVQVEDWLRPDSGEFSLQRQRDLIETLSGINNFDVPGFLNTGCDLNLSPLRLAGVPKNPERNQPRMHHKFALFGNRSDGGCAYFHTVFTGSFNWTRNATNSLENGVFLRGTDIVDAYKREYFEILLTSRTIKEEWWGESYGWDAEDFMYLREGT